MNRVQATPRSTAANTTSVTMTFATPPTTGSGVVVSAFMFRSGFSATVACQDSYGNKYTSVLLQISGNIAVAVFFCPKVISGGGAFAVTLTGSVGSIYFEACAVEVGGLVNGLAVDQTKFQAGTGLTGTTGLTAALVGTEAFLASVIAIAANQPSSILVESVSPPWTQEFENLNYSATVAGEVDDRIRTGVSGTTQSCTWSWPTSATYVAALVAFTDTATAASLISITQEAIEVLTEPILPETRVTQAAVESLSLPIAAVRVTQQAVEVLSLTPDAGPDLSSARVSQTAVEVIFAPSAVQPAKLSQMAVEVMIAPSSTQPGKLSQVAVEVMYLPGPSGAAGVSIWMGEVGGVIWVD